MKSAKKNWKDIWLEIKWLPIVILGCAIFSIGFDLFLEPHEFNCGGLSGFAQVIIELFGLDVYQWGTVGIMSALMNVPLFIIGGKKIGRKFFIGSLVGMLSMSFFLDLFTIIPVPDTEPLLAGIYGGLISGLGMGFVFLSTVSSGGTDIVARLLKQKQKNAPIGKINLCIDAVIAILTGIVFKDVTKTLYTGVTLYISSMVVDMVIYSFDYSKVVLIISPKYEEVAKAISEKLKRGVTYLEGVGYYSGKETRVILSAVKKQQVADLKEVVVDVDPKAFIILQEAHQVLGDGFSRYDKNAL